MPVVHALVVPEDEGWVNGWKYVGCLWECNEFIASKETKYKNSYVKFTMSPAVKVGDE